MRSTADAGALEALAQEALKAQGASIAVCLWNSRVPCPVSVFCDQAGAGNLTVFERINSVGSLSSSDWL